MSFPIQMIQSPDTKAMEHICRDLHRWAGHTLITRNRSIRKTHHFSTLRKSTAWLKFQLKHLGCFPWWCWDPPPLSGENECEVGARKFWLWCWLRKRFTIGCHPTQCLWSYLVPHWSQQSVWIHTQDQQQWQWQHALLVMAKHQFNFYFRLSSYTLHSQGLLRFGA